MWAMWRIGLREAKPCHTARHRVPVRPVGCHRVVRVRDGDDARNERDVLVAESVRISLAVDSLMVMADDSGDLRVLVDIGEDSLADRRVLLHLAAFLECQSSGFLEQTGRESDLPDVVNEAGNERALLLF